MQFQICVAVFEGTPLNVIVLEVEPAPGETFPGQFSKRQIEQLAICELILMNNQLLLRTPHAVYSNLQILVMVILFHSW